MNHLAHVHLSGLDPEILVGNISADYLRKRECLELPLKLQEGVALHRHIDHSTDNHPEIKGAWAVLRPRHGKYASVIFDIYCDYLLASRWHEFESQHMQVVAERAYKAIQEQGQHLPEDLFNRFKRMIESDWLRQYGTYEGQAYVFERFGKRLSKPELLDGVIDTLRTNEDVFAKAFKAFYPWMQASCKEMLGPVQ
ncbi:MAG: ACP phosphodiesterase [Saprospiraceae bacterium]